jgi:glyoxylase-like metal-dependent hydrolase (beta-lactamase superfamily II)
VNRSSNASRTLDRRTFVTDLGRGTFALAILAVTGCAPASSGSARPSAAGGSAPASAAPPPDGSAAPGTSDDASPAAPTGAPTGPGASAWTRVNLGFVSAYILVRGGEAAIVDTGVAGSADAVEASLAGLGLDWTAVGHLVLTHHHGDHAGSAAEILGRAPEATGYAGGEDIPAITVPRPLTPVQDGDRVFDLEVITAPGHTAGSICLLDPAGSVLVAGDALGTEGGRPTFPGEQFTDDMDEAVASVARLGALTFERLLVGHGEPIEAGASRLVAELASTR